MNRGSQHGSLPYVLRSLWSVSPSVNKRSCKCSLTSLHFWLFPPRSWHSTHAGFFSNLPSFSPASVALQILFPIKGICSLPWLFPFSHSLPSWLPCISQVSGIKYKCSFLRDAFTDHLKSSHSPLPTVILAHSVCDYLEPYLCIWYVSSPETAHFGITHTAPDRVWHGAQNRFE